MKNIKLITALLMGSFSIISCEDVVDIKLDTAAPKLVIDAAIKWQKETDGSNQKIKLTTTTDYYSATIPAATGATVTVTNTSLSTPLTFQFIENAQTGEYICNNFKPIVNNNYTLNIVYRGQSYAATSILTSTPEIVKKEQILKPGFGGADFYEVKFYFQDKATENNFYLVSAKNSTLVIPEYGVLDDKFTQGNLMFAVYQAELKKGDIIDYTVQGIPEKYGNYMSKLISIAGSTSGAPFATAPATLRGNIINTNNVKNFPFGYFHLSEIDSGSHTIE
ncbi:DUF4249 family protein [Flavobacterium sp.]|uniref:DUF4249 family protein n=1 Tax=Flavobacterium sp. TaxID=239 RepID=UPI00286E9301|nr:DUF4249 family protein [Flavobacterium sp.]